MRLRRARQARRTDENLIPLINIVFLILIFFLVASTIRPFSDRGVVLAETQQAPSSGAVRRTLLLTRDGAQFADGEAVDKAALSAAIARWASEPERAVTIVADAESDAAALVDAASRLGAAGLNNVQVLTRRK